MQDFLGIIPCNNLDDETPMQDKSFIYEKKSAFLFTTVVKLTVTWKNIYSMMENYGKVRELFYGDHEYIMPYRSSQMYTSLYEKTFVQLVLYM